MFYDDLFCSLTSSFYPKTSTVSTVQTENSELENVSENSKFFSEINRLYILGNEYSKPIDEKELLKDVSTRLWFTYRKGFSQINGNGPDSDQGWGCMIRCGQMMLAETFIRLYLGREFRWDLDSTGNPFYWRILSYFKDEKLAPYSIQQIAMMGVGEGIPVGKWFGPNAIAQVLNKLTTYEESNHLRFYIAMDNCIFIDEIYELMKTCNKCIKCKLHKKGKCEEWSPLLLIIPLRLGLNEFNQDYIEPLKRCLEIKYTVGLIGGKPNQAYYFYGYLDDELLYMDPHECQSYVPKFVEEMNDKSYHTNIMWKLKFSQLDPSIALGFVCKHEEDFLELIDLMRKNVVKDGDLHSLFDISAKRPDFDSMSATESLDFNSDDEFVLI
ncbi:cysteine protease ATG4A [Brachionus plicatilis]|uniref:Cysteine protease n=1 Tax=Brachionus plicatilis TaxID=10195 RepID=A0A3M7P1S7_BRAPC|nr:cysteine protease ATG4A [Brachionus plicatilis]